MMIFFFKHLFFHVGSVEIRQAGPVLSAHLMSLVCFGICCSLQASHHASTHESLEMKMKAAARSVDAHTQALICPKSVCVLRQLGAFQVAPKTGGGEISELDYISLFNFPNSGVFAE